MTLTQNEIGSRHRISITIQYIARLVLQLCEELSVCIVTVFLFVCLFVVVLLRQDTTHLLQRPCYQQGSPCQDPAGNWTTRRPPDDRKETQTAVVWSCFPFIRSGQNQLARHSERKEDKADRGRGGKTTSENGQTWRSPSPRGQWRTGENGGNWLRNHLWCPNDPRG